MLTIKLSLVDIFVGNLASRESQKLLGASIKLTINASKKIYTQCFQHNRNNVSLSASELCLLTATHYGANVRCFPLIYTVSAQPTRSSSLSKRYMSSRHAPPFGTSMRSATSLPWDASEHAHGCREGLAFLLAYRGRDSYTGGGGPLARFRVAVVTFGTAIYFF